MNGCADVRTALGVYVVGAIDPAERGRVEAHLAGCPACRDELAGLAGLPALLGRVEEAQLAQVAGTAGPDRAEPPDPEFLDSLLARASEQRRGALGPLGRRLGGRGAGIARWAPLAAAACLLLVVGALFGGFVFPASGGGRAASPPAASATPSPGPEQTAEPAGRGERIVAVNPGNQVRGVVYLQRREWGTQVELYLSGVPKGEHCRMMVIARDGRRDAIGSWSVPYDRGYGDYHGSTMFPRGQLYSFEIVGLDGKPLLTIPT
ncbi:anti-sigma factor family protein [Actinomadura verrucosospora]|uniref:anti-sigma factor family protein n=1 Tax=Actinomadura verrucosospora TaxID=46165 RepID=UPI001563B30F|nr:zf-HC2 domain-containing protein [Actinomadura verrucosospora]